MPLDPDNETVSPQTVKSVVFLLPPPVCLVCHLGSWGSPRWVHRWGKERFQRVPPWMVSYFQKNNGG